MKDLYAAHSMRKRLKKMANGGKVDSRAEELGNEAISAGMPAIGKQYKTGNYSPYSDEEEAREEAMPLPSQKVAPDVKGMASGGRVKEEKSGFVDHEGDDVKRNGMAMEEDDRMLNQHGEDEMGPDGVWMADGGDTDMPDESTPTFSAPAASGGGGGGGMGSIMKMLPMLAMAAAEGGMVEGGQDDKHMDDMVGRVMAQRQRMYSKGGKVANDTPITADFKKNDFDDLAMRDDLEYEYTGKNSGDEIGNEGEDGRRKDIVSRIMKSRAKKDRNPRPA